MTALMVATSVGEGKIVTKNVPYKHGDVELEGYLAYDDAKPGKRPGVIVVHEWWGLNDFAKERARMLAELGYVGFAADLYGKGLVTDDPQRARELAEQFRGSDPTRLRARAKAAYDTLAADERVDSKRIGAIGFCFGGTTVLQMAYSGLDLAGVVSFHGNPMPPRPDDLKRIKAKVLVLHGAADTHVTAETIAAFQKAMEDAGVDWQWISYAKAKHSFTNPESSKRNMPGVGYQKEAAERSWRHMRLFFKEAFGLA